MNKYTDPTLDLMNNDYALSNIEMGLALIVGACVLYLVMEIISNQNPQV